MSEQPRTYLTLTECGQILSAVDAAWRAVGGTKTDTGLPIRTLLSESRRIVLDAITPSIQAEAAARNDLDRRIAFGEGRGK